MSCWELLSTICTLSLDVAVLPTLLSPVAYVPRRTSGLMAVGVLGIGVGLFGVGLPLLASVNVLGAALWAVVFMLRGRR